MAARRAELTPRQVAHEDSCAGSEGVVEEEAVERRKRVAKDTRMLKGCVLGKKGAGGKKTHRWAIVVHASAIESFHSSDFTGVLKCVGGRESCVSMESWTYLRCGG
jgi:hypothetical protein